MRIQKFEAENNAQVLRLVKKEFGESAVIMSSKNTPNGVEVVAADRLPDKEIVDVEKNQADSMRNIEKELFLLRNLLQDNMVSLYWESEKQKDPQKSSVINKLLESSYIQEAIELLVQTKLDSSFEVNINNLKQKILNLLSPKKSFDIFKKGIYSFYGLPGVGKTTVVAKIASQHVMRYGSDDIAIISLDESYVGYSEKIKKYCEMLDVPIKSVEKNESDLKNAIYEFRNKNLILIDAGIDKFSVIESIINIPVISANLQANNILEQYDENLNIILTKVDLTKSLGEIISTMLVSKLSLLLYTKGQDVVKDILYKLDGNIVDLSLTNNLVKKNIARKYTKGILDEQKC